jgi:hypothetical protein
MTRYRVLLLFTCALTGGLLGQALAGGGLQGFQVAAYLLSMTVVFAVFLASRRADRRR